MTVSRKKRKTHIGSDGKPENRKTNCMVSIPQLGFSGFPVFPDLCWMHIFRFLNEAAFVFFIFFCFSCFGSAQRGFSGFPILCKAKLYEYEQVRPLELREAIERYRASLLPDYRTKTVTVGNRIIRVPKTRAELMLERKKINLEKNLKRTQLHRASWAPKASDWRQRDEWTKTIQNWNQPRQRDWSQLRK